MEQESDKTFLVGAAASEASFKGEGSLMTNFLPKPGLVANLNDI